MHSVYELKHSIDLHCHCIMQRNSIQSASNFVCRNRLPPRLKEQILAYMCLRFKAESLNQQQLIEQLPKTICKSIRHHLFLPTVEKVYLFKGVSREILLHLVRQHYFMQYTRTTRSKISISVVYLILVTA